MSSRKRASTCYCVEVYQTLGAPGFTSNTPRVRYRVTQARSADRAEPETRADTDSAADAVTLALGKASKLSLIADRLVMVYMLDLARAVTQSWRVSVTAPAKRERRKARVSGK